jgi:hypothetical protein
MEASGAFALIELTRCVRDAVEVRQARARRQGRGLQSFLR